MNKVAIEKNEPQSGMAPQDFFNSFSKPLVKEVVTDSEGGSLRERRQRATTRALSVAPKFELLEGDKQPSPDALPVEQPKDAPAALEAIHEAADKGIEAALPPLNEEAEELAPLVGMERFDESGTLMPKSDTLVTKGDFQEGGIVVSSREGNEEIIADALSSNIKEVSAPSAPKANADRAAHLMGKVPDISEQPIVDIVPEMPVKGVEEPFLSDAVKPKGAPDQTGGANIIFDSSGSKADPIADMAIKHDGNGTADKEIPDRMEPVLQEGLAPLKAPVIPKQEMINLEPETLAENADQLVTEVGGLAEAAPVKVAVDNSEAKISEPHPFVAADAPTPEKAVSVAGEETDEQILERMTRTGESLDGTVPVAETSVEVKAAPEVAIATSEVVAVAPEVKSGFKPELLRGDEQPSAALKAVSPVVQPEAPAVANADPSGIWQPKAKRSLLSKIFGPKHEAEDLAYHKNPNVTAADVLATQADRSEEPKIAKVA